jgi:hypothetical protein
LARRNTRERAKGGVVAAPVSTGGVTMQTVAEQRGPLANPRCYR